MTKPPILTLDVYWKTLNEGQDELKQRLGSLIAQAWQFGVSGHVFIGHFLFPILRPCFSHCFTDLTLLSSPDKNRKSEIQKSNLSSALYFVFRSGIVNLYFGTFGEPDKIRNKCQKLVSVQKQSKAQQFV